MLLIAIAALAGCGGDGVVEPVGGAFSLGQSVSLGSGREVRVQGGTAGGEFVAVVVNSSLDSAARSSFSLRAESVAALTSTGVSSARLPDHGDDSGAPDRNSAPRFDESFEDGLRARERELAPKFAAARAWRSTSVPTLPRVPIVGELITVNVNPTDACTTPRNRATRVVAVSARSIILSDTLNPRPGFSSADFQRIAARFDTLVYPMDVAAFGEPTDIDGNGRVVLVFTRAVNELTPFLGNTFVGGLTFSRDLFPQAGSSRAQACATSNEGEYFYLLAPDPGGSINGNRRTIGFVDTTTTAVLAHELVHLINASRKLYVHTNAPKFEERWLDEGLAHVAEELLFYREAGLAPRMNLASASLVASPRTRGAYQSDMVGNASRYRLRLRNPSNTSPYAAGDSLATRGATWSFLRYLADRSSTDDGNVWSRLTNNTAVGTANLRAVFGNDVGSLVRDWSVSHAVDDVVVTEPQLQWTSWNWRQIYSAGLGGAETYPLEVTTMLAATSYSGMVVAGGAAFYRFAVPPSGTATLTLGAQSGAASSNLQLVIVRTK